MGFLPDDIASQLTPLYGSTSNADRLLAFWKANGFTEWPGFAAERAFYVERGAAGSTFHDSRADFWNRVGLGSAFSPLQLSPALWFDASDVTTITASGGRVSQWSDKSGNARHVIQEVALLQPTTGAATLNSKNVLTFSGNNWLRVVGHNFDPSSPGVSLFATVRADIFPAGAALATVVAQGDGPGVGRQYLQVNATGFDTRLANGVPCTLTPTFPERWVSMRATNSGGAAQTARLTRNNSATVSTVSQMGSTTGPLFVGTNKAATGGFFTGQIAELVIFGRVLTSEETQSVETYLNRKWNIY